MEAGPHVTVVVASWPELHACGFVRQRLGIFPGITAVTQTAITDSDQGS